MKLKLTPKGIDLLINCLGLGPTLSFTGIALGNGADAGEEATEMSNPLETLAITDIERLEGSEYITLTASLNNSNIESRFHITEMGVYAQSPAEENRNILFAYGWVPEEEAAIIPAVTDYAFETIEKVSVYVGAVEDVTAIIAEGMATVTKKEFLQHLGDENNPHKVTKSQVGLGNVPNVSTDNQSPTVTLITTTYDGSYSDNFNDGSQTGDNENMNLVPKNGDKMSVIIKKLSSAAKAFVKHLYNKSNPHQLTPSSIGAAPATHKHSTNDITEGVLSLARGGTGVKTLEDLKTLLGLDIKFAVTSLLEAKSISDEWEQDTSNGGYYQTIEIEGIQTTDSPIVDVLLGSDIDANKLYLDAWLCVSRISTKENSITLWANKSAPMVSFNIQLKVVR